jgi:hypothetical protein
MCDSSTAVGTSNASFRNSSLVIFRYGSVGTQRSKAGQSAVTSPKKKNEQNDDHDHDELRLSQAEYRCE